MIPVVLAAIEKVPTAPCLPCGTRRQKGLTIEGRESGVYQRTKDRPNFYIDLWQVEFGVLTQKIPHRQGWVRADSLGLPLTSPVPQWIHEHRQKRTELYQCGKAERGRPETLKGKGWGKVFLVVWGRKGRPGGTACPEPLEDLHARMINLAFRLGQPTGADE